MPKSFIVFGVELPWIYPLAAELGKTGHAVGVRLGASHSPWRSGALPPFPYGGGELRAEAWTYPAGFNRALDVFFRRPIRGRLGALLRRVEEESGEVPFVLTPEPRFLGYLGQVKRNRLVYLNYDDYSEGRGAARGKRVEQEDAMVAHAGTIICASRYQSERFKERFPTREVDVFHLPHGVHESFVNPDPAQSPEQDTVCSVGYLSSRYDWALIHEVVSRLPEVMFSFIGEISWGAHVNQREEWPRLLQATLARDNVQHISGLRHWETAHHYWRSAVNWMPYKDDLAFVKASCPLKLSDGLASGRAVVSADVPECRLYPEWVKIYRSPGEAVDTIGRALNEASQEDATQRSRSQIAYARRNSWHMRALALSALLEAADDRANANTGDGRS